MPDDLEALLRREIERHIEDRGWDHWEAEDRGRYRDALAARLAEVLEVWAMTEGEPGDPAAAIAQRIVARAFRERDAVRESESEAVGLLEEYGGHKAHCSTGSYHTVRGRRVTTPCTCGYDDKARAYLARRKEASQ